MSVRKDSRGGYAGDVVTPANRREYMAFQAEKYLQQQLKIADNTKSEELLKLESEGYARHKTNQEIRHFEAYLAGKNSYKYKGLTLPVLTKSLIEQMRKDQKMITINKVDETV